MANDTQNSQSAPALQNGQTVILHTVELKAGEPTKGLDTLQPGGLFIVGGKEVDAYGIPPGQLPTLDAKDALIAELQRQLAEAKTAAPQADSGANISTPVAEKEGEKPAPPTETPLDQIALTELIGVKAVTSLATGGYTTREKLAAATDTELGELPEIGPKTVEKLREFLAGSQG